MCEKDQLLFWTQYEKSLWEIWVAAAHLIMAIMRVIDVTIMVVEIIMLIINDNDDNQ